MNYTHSEQNVEDDQEIFTDLREVVHHDRVISQQALNALKQTIIHFNKNNDQTLLYVNITM